MGASKSLHEVDTIVYSFYRWRKWLLEGLSNLPKATQLTLRQEFNWIKSMAL